MTLLNKLKKTWGLDEADFAGDDRAMQKRLAPFLRKKAIEYLATGEGVVAKGFRGEYLASGQGDWREFLAKQLQGGWGTYLEAAAIGEASGCNIVVTPVKNGVEQSPICLYRGPVGAPTVNMHNRDNTHWYVVGAKTPTLGNGDCLYHALAQGLKKEVTVTAASPSDKNASTPTPLSSQSLFTPPPVPHHEIIAHQQAIEAAIAQQPTPDEMTAEFQHEKERISKLPTQEQQQIAADHKLALALAREEMGYATKNVYYNYSTGATTKPSFQMR